MSEPDEGQRFKDLWAWADEDGDERITPPVSPEHVAAVMVVRDAAAWLPEQLSALATSEQRPGSIVCVDVSSNDESAKLLAQAEETGSIERVVSIERDTTFAEAVAAGASLVDAPWLWILHDDITPDPDALAQLLTVAPTADLVYPKLVEPRRRNYPDLIAECGQSMTRGGRRVGIPEEGDIDQQQLEPGATLGGSTAGMLVRSDLWRELHGLAPELLGRRDGLDFGWRANIAGWRVVTAPLATLVRRRTPGLPERLTGHHPHFDDRVAALRLASVHGAGGLRLRLASWMRSVGFLLAKSPDYAGAELRAHRYFASTKAETAACKERIPAGDTSEVDDLLPVKYWGVRKTFDTLGNAIADRYREFTADTSLDELTSDEFAAHDANPRPLLAPGVLVTIVFLLAGVGAGWRLWGGTDLAGGGMLPAPANLASAWEAFARDGEPALGIGALIGTLLGGQPWLAGFVAVLLGPLLAALSMHSCVRHLGVRAGMCAVAAGLWGAATLMLGLPSAGDISGLVVAIVAPRVLVQLSRMVTERGVGAESLRAPAVGALWLFVAAAFWPPALLIATLTAIVAPLLPRQRIAPWATLVVPVWLLFLPWVGKLFHHPARFLTGVDPLAWPAFPPAGWALLLGRLMPTGVPVWLSIVFFGGLALLALWGLLRIPQPARRWCTAAGIVAPLLIGAGVSRLALSVDGGQARALLSPWALCVVGGMIAAVVAAERPRDLRHRSRISGSVAVLLIAVAVCTWPWVGLCGPVSTGHEALPRYVRSVVESPRASRALLIDKAGDRLTWNVVAADRPQWGSAEQHPAGQFDAEFEELVQAFAGTQVPDDLAERLQTVAVSHVWLRGFTPDELLAVSNAEGLTSASASTDATVVTVTGLVSRANILSGTTRTPVVDATVPAGEAGRLLVVHDPTVTSARVADTALERVEGDLPTFKLGQLHGVLEYSVRHDWFGVGWMVFVLVVLGVLALPTMDRRSGARRAGEDG